MDTHSTPKTIAVLSTIALLTASSAAVALSQKTEARIQGTYELSSSKEQARSKIDEKIEGVIEDFNFIKKPIARSRLRETTKPCETMTFRFSEDEISTRCGDDPFQTTPVDGAKTKIEWKDETLTLSQDVGKRKIVQTYYAEDGKRTNVYVFDKSGDEMEVHSVLESSQLDEPLRFSLSYEEK
jgi:hypothetical protein